MRAPGILSAPDRISVNDLPGLRTETGVALMSVAIDRTANSSRRIVAGCNEVQRSHGLGAECLNFEGDGSGLELAEASKFQARPDLS
jgi:hypothetical protein